MNITHVWKRAGGAGGRDISWNDILIRESSDHYHAQANKYLSSHRLSAFRECPLLYRRWQLGEVVDEDRPAYVLGRAAHALILEGLDVFQKQYVVGGPINPRTGLPFGANTKAFSEWAQQIDKEVLSHDQARIAKQMNDSIRCHPLGAELLARGIPEGVIRAEYRGIPCQIRLDWVAPEYGIVDLKTSDNLTWFESDARKFHYLHQLAFYRSVAAEATGELLPVYLIAVEKREPFRCGVWLVGQDVLGAAQHENEEAMVRLRHCLTTNDWPTGYESLRTFDWM